MRSAYLRCIMIAMLLSMMLFLPAPCSNASTVEVSNGELDAISFSVNVVGFQKVEWSFESYSAYADFLPDIDETESWLGFPSINLDYVSDCLSDDSVSSIAFIAYYTGEGFRGYIEIYEYGSESSAKNEFDYQDAQDDSDNAPIYNRFDLGGWYEWMYQTDRFLLFAFGECGTRTVPEYNIDFLNLLTVFVENMHQVISDAAAVVEPVVSFTGDVVWGIQPGDTLKWEIDRSILFQSRPTQTIEWEIASISSDNKAVLINDIRTRARILGEGTGWSNYLGGSFLMDRGGVSMSYYDSYWGTVDDDGLLVDESFYTYSLTPLIYPLYAGGVDLKSMVEDEIGYLPERDVVETADYIKVYGNTYSDSQIETIWEDVYAHRGTGIVTYVDYYYNNNEYSTSATYDVALVEHNIDLETREPYTPPATTSSTTSPATTTTGTTGVTEPTGNGGQPEGDLGSVMILGLAGGGIIVAVIVIVILKQRASS